MHRKPARLLSVAERAWVPPIRGAIIEKPPLDVATQFVASGDYFWNSGMFVFKAERYLASSQPSHPISSTRLGPRSSPAKTDLDFVRMRPG